MASRAPLGHRWGPGVNFSGFWLNVATVCDQISVEFGLGLARFLVAEPLILRGFGFRDLAGVQDLQPRLPAPAAAAGTRRRRLGSAALFKVKSYAGVSGRLLVEDHSSTSTVQAQCLSKVT